MKGKEIPATEDLAPTSAVKQVELIRKGVRFVTTQTDIGLLPAAAGRWTGDLRAAIARPAR